MSPATPDLWHDERGFVISAELTLISTIVVLAMVVGMAGLSNSITQELTAMSTPANPSQNFDRYPSLGFAQQALSDSQTGIASTSP